MPPFNGVKPTTPKSSPTRASFLVSPALFLLEQIAMDRRGRVVAVVVVMNDVGKVAEGARGCKNTVLIAKTRRVLRFGSFFYRDGWESVRHTSVQNLKATENHGAAQSGAECKHAAVKASIRLKSRHQLRLPWFSPQKCGIGQTPHCAKFQGHRTKW